MDFQLLRQLAGLPKLQEGVEQNFKIKWELSHMSKKSEGVDTIRAESFDLAVAKLKKLLKRRQEVSMFDVEKGTYTAQK